MGEILSGKNMAVNAAAGSKIFAFRINVTHYPPWMVGGNQSGGVARELGNTDWDVMYRENNHTPTVFPGDSFTFECAPKQTGNVAVSGTALCTAIEIVVDSRDPRNPVPIYSTVQAKADGTLSLGQTAPTDTATTVLYSPKGLCAYFGSSQTHTKYQRLKIFTRGDVETVDCTTDGQVQRDTGELDAEFEWIINTDDSSDFPLASAGEQTARCYVESAAYWEINWMEIAESPGPWMADRRSRPNTPVDARFLAKFTGHSGTTPGTIVNPAGATKWPS